MKIFVHLRKHLIIGTATAGYIGKIPFAPGTFGSLPGILLFWLVAPFPLGIGLLVLAAIIAAAVWAADRAEHVMGCKDPKSVVIDEIAGMGVAFAGLPFSWPVAAAGFIVFRFFDIVKPYPIGWLEKKYSGGLGVVIDDVAAGLITRVVLGIGCYLI
ncbi:MAG: phosphatidylglycerophosphatase A family protein [Thermodesulfobacteriota bacterium]